MRASIQSLSHSSETGGKIPMRRLALGSSVKEGRSLNKVYPRRTLPAVLNPWMIVGVYVSVKKSLFCFLVLL